MRLSRFTTAEMLALSTPWITPGSPANTALGAQPELAPLLPRLSAAHSRLLGRQSTLDPRGPALTKQLAVLDEEHDTLARGIDSTLMALMFLSPDDAGREFWERTRQTLFPAGLGIINLAYAAEAGNAMLLEKRLDGLPAADKKTLKGQTVAGQSLWDLIARFVAVGLEIGQRETERQNLEPQGPAPGELHAARLEWARIVAALLALIDLGTASPDPSLAPLFVAPLRSADARATRRRAGKGDADAGDPGQPAEPGQPGPGPAPGAGPSK